MSEANQEYITIVDRQNRVTGSRLRSDMRRENLIHRAAYVLVFNDREELFMQKRTFSKDVFPGYWDIAAGGVVLSGETYEQAAKRELFEELGISGITLIHHFLRYYEDADNRVWGGIFSCHHPGPFVLQAEEIEHGLFLKPAEVWELAEKEPLTPDGLEILKLLSDNRKEGNCDETFSAWT